MEVERIILKKIVDDPGSRKKVLGVLVEDHFSEKATKYLYRVISGFPADAVVTFRMLEDCIARQSIPETAKTFLYRIIGEVAATSAVLSHELDYAISQIIQEAKLTTYANELQRAARYIEQRDVLNVERIIRGLPDDANRLSGRNFRRISARTTRDLVAETDVDRYTTGFKIIDNITGGGRRGELWFWLAAAAELKSTALLSIAHTCCVRGKNVFFASMEMEEDELRGRLLCYHGIHCGKQLYYSETLKTKEYGAEVRDDFDTNPAYGKLELWQPPIGVTILDAAKEFEIACGEDDYDVFIIDYLQKFAPVTSRFRDRESLNETLDLAKKLALETRNGKRAWVVSGYQASRDGRKKARELGFYTLEALSESIYAEQVPNVVCWSMYTEQMRAKKEAKVGICKARNANTDGATHFLVCDPAIGLLSKEPVSDDTELASQDFLDAIQHEFSD